MSTQSIQTIGASALPIHVVHLLSATRRKSMVAYPPAYEQVVVAGHSVEPAHILNRRQWIRDKCGILLLPNHHDKADWWRELGLGTCAGLDFPKLLAHCTLLFSTQRSALAVRRMKAHGLNAERADPRSKISQLDQLPLPQIDSRLCIVFSRAGKDFDLFGRSRRSGPQY